MDSIADMYAEIERITKIIDDKTELSKKEYSELKNKLLDIETMLKNNICLINDKIQLLRDEREKFINTLSSLLNKSSEFDNIKATDTLEPVIEEKPNNKKMPKPKNIKNKNDNTITIKDDVNDDVKIDIKDDIKEDVKNDIKEDVKEEKTKNKRVYKNKKNDNDEIIKDNNDIKEDVKDNIKEDIKEEKVKIKRAPKNKKIEN
jgi:hypothetical protein